jgi:DNA-directed RNA polymerase subunit RPC12/RpoP
MTNPCCPDMNVGEPTYALSTTAYRCRVCGTFADALWRSKKRRVRRLRCEKCGHDTNHDPYCEDSDGRCIRYVDV